MRRLTLITAITLFLFLGSALLALAQTEGLLSDLPYLRDYKSRRISSYDRTGANDDGQWSNPIKPGETRLLAEIKGAGVITHIWFTISSPDPHHLKKLVLRMYWDGEAEPSVECPVGDFFGLGLGEYFHFQSGPIMIGTNRALNCFWRMPFARSAKITVTYETDKDLAQLTPEERKKELVRAFYYYIDYEEHTRLPQGMGYFHAQYRQQTPCDGWTDWYFNSEEKVNKKPNLKGEGNYIILEAEGRGHYVGVAHSLYQNQDDWWGEGDDMIFIDGSELPVLYGTGSEDYYGGAWGFGTSFFYPYIGCHSPEKEGYKREAKWSVYRFHLESPIAFQRSIKVTIEHGHANHRSDNYYTVAYWYQTELHHSFPPLPEAKERIPRLINLAGKGR